MNNQVPQHLRVISLEKLRAIGDIPGIAVLTPDDLVRNRGIDVGDLFAQKIFVDSDLGYAIVNERIAQEFIKTLNIRIKILKEQSPYLENFPQIDDSDIHDNWRARIKSRPESEKLVDDAERKQLPWYVNPKDEWPKQRGAGVRVVVFDSGISSDIARMKRDEQDKDFCDCLAPGQRTWAVNMHGTKSAGAIGADDDQEIRTSPAPDCTIIAAQVTRGDGVFVHLADLLLMLSWAVRAWDVRVGCLSLALDRNELEYKDQKDILSQVAMGLRERNQMLLFAASDETDGRLSYPACLDGFVAVGTFFRKSPDSSTVYKPDSALKDELLFGPEAGVLTVTPRGPERYDDPSAACAYVTGVAALYVERYYESKGIKGVLDELFPQTQGSLKVTEESWPGVRLHPEPMSRRAGAAPQPAPADG
ncbi:S8/S53 family peptidase [Tahibacter sp. UC22_41]|uniref:S8/S53 family peptidase n=1 Tax=Tahibacter sp. UC22_41 TaxID=3350178 RepID=UPI0036DC28BD